MAPDEMPRSPKASHMVMLIAVTFLQYWLENEGRAAPVEWKRPRGCCAFGKASLCGYRAAGYSKGEASGAGPEPPLLLEESRNTTSEAWTSVRWRRWPSSPSHEFWTRRPAT